jgi:UDP-glucuronate 4-epimerase
MNRILLTGAAGFIGFHVTRAFLARGDKVVGVDSLNDYYEVELKQARVRELEKDPHFKLHHLDLANREATKELLASQPWDAIVHLAAQVGVRYSVENPMAYVDSNLSGFMHVLEGAQKAQVKHFVYASSSSVYGANTKMPFSVQDNVDHPISLYAATKRANELLAHSYSDISGLPTTGLRFFTVYGPWGRPDMAVFKFTRAILAGEPIPVYNHGKMKRDFTYVDDVAEAIVRVTDRPPEPNPNWLPDSHDPSSSRAPFRVYNIGNHTPVELKHLIQVIETCLGVKAELELLPMQPGDVPMTYADVDTLVQDVDFQPSTTIEDGVARFVEWYRGHYG